MYIIAGLGNPTKTYEGTRHNVGFRVIDKIAQDYHISVDTKKHKALCGKGVIEGQKVILAKPQTFMNLSGESIRAMADYYKVDPQDILIIFDDVSLDVGHNGIKSIIAHLGTNEFPRIKVGVGEKPKGWDLADYVLGKFSGEDAGRIDEAAADASSAVKIILTQDIDAAMNQFNAKKKA